MFYELDKFNFKALLLFTLVLLSLQASGQWVKRAKSVALTRTTALSHDTAGNVYSAGLMTCNTVFETDTLFNNSCAEVSLPAPSGTQLDVFIASHDTDGNLNWVSQLTGEPDNKILVNGLVADDVGNSYLGGEYIYNLDLGGVVLMNDDTTSDAFLAKILADGSTSWGLKIGSSDSSLIMIQDVAIDNSSVYVSGQFRGRIDVGAANDSVKYKSAFLASYDLDGNPQWLKTLPPVETTSQSIGQAITVDGGLLYMLVNFTDSVAVTPSDTLVPPQTVNSASAILKYQPNGTLISFTILNAAKLNDIDFYAPGLSLYATGTYSNDFAVGGDTILNDTGTKAFLLSTDENLLPQWLLPIESDVTSSLTGKGVSVNDVGNIFLAGTYGGSFIMADGITTMGNTTVNGFLLKTDATGTASWLQTVGGSGSDEVLAISARDEDRIYCGGYFEDYVRFGPNEIYNTSSASHGFVARLDVCPQLLADIDMNPVNYLCDGEALTLQATQNAAYSYTWYKDGVVVGGAANYNYVTQEEAVYQAKVVGMGCTKLTPTRELRLNPLPDTTVAVNKALIQCVGDSLTLSGPTSTYDFQWLEAGNPILGANGQAIKVGTDGDYALRVTTDSLCMLTSGIREVRFLNYPDSMLNLESRQVICAGDNVLLQAEDDPSFSYEWYQNEAVIPLATASSYSVVETGIYNVLITNIAGCTSLTGADTVVVQAAPIIDLNDETIDPLLCQGDSVLLSTTFVSTQSYQWRRNGTNISGAVSNSIKVKQGGDYVVYVANSTCNDVSDVVSLTDVPLPTSQIVSVSSAVICQGETSVLEANGGGSITYQWLRNGSEMPGATDKFLSVMESGTYNVVTTNASGCAKESIPQVIVVNIAPPAKVTIVGESTACEGESVELRGNDGTGLKYQWLKEGSSITGATDRIFYADVSGAYAVEVTNSNLCMAQSAPKDVQVIAAPHATITAGINAICQGDSLQLKATEDITYSYNWLLNGASLAHETSESFFAKQPGDYQSLVYVGDCRDTSAIFPLTIIANPKPTVTRNDDFLSISLFGEIQWFVDGELLADANGQNIQVKQEGDYTVQVINDQGCIAISDPYKMCLPIPEISRKNEVLIVNVANQRYKWYFKGSPIGGATKQTLTAQQSGEYSVVMTNEDGCAMESFPVTVCIPYPYISQDEQTGILYANPSVAKAYLWYYDSIPLPSEDLNVLIPDSAGRYKVEVTDFDDCTSISEPFEIAEITSLTDNQKGVNIFPNPVRDALYIRVPLGESVNAYIYNLDGKLIKSQFIGEKGRIDMTYFNTGTYLLVLVKGDGNIITKVWKE